MAVIPSSPISPVTRSTAGNSQVDDAKSFRDADFMKIILKEITQQDPFKPQDTSQLVENVQKLQALENSRFTKFRDDLRFAQDIAGKTVTMSEVALDPVKLKQFQQAGLKIGQGFGTVTGKVDSFRVVNEEVFVSVQGKDYPLDNLQQIKNDQSANDPARLVSLAQGLLGGKVGFSGDTSVKPPLPAGSGIVTDVALDKGEVMLTIGDRKIPFSRVTSIGIPAKP